MAAETQTVTKYGVARGEKLISGGWDNVDLAKNDLALFTNQMIHLGLDPDVRLVEYDVDTTVKTSRVRAYREPEPDVVETEGEPEDAAPGADA